MRPVALGISLLVLAACSGKSSAPTASTAETPPAPKPVRRYEMVAEARRGSPYSTPEGAAGCVIIHATDGDSACGKLVRLDGADGTRGTVEAVPESGYRFIRWSPFSDDCPGETANPCSFAFDRAKSMTAEFGRD